MEDEQRPLKRSEHVRNAISNEKAAKEYTARNTPMERDTRGKDNMKIGNIDKPRGSGKVKFFSHPDRVIDFTKGPCRRMNTKEVEQRSGWSRGSVPSSHARGQRFEPQRRQYFQTTA